MALFLTACNLSASSSSESSVSKGTTSSSVPTASGEDAIYQYKAEGKASPFDALDELDKIPFGGTAEDLLHYDASARLAYTTFVGTSYYVSNNRSMMDMDGLVVYWMDASQHLAEAWFAVPNVGINAYFSIAEKLSDLTEGQLDIVTPNPMPNADGGEILLSSNQKKELLKIGDDIASTPPDLSLSTLRLASNSTIKANAIASLGISFHGSEHLFVFTKNFSESANFNDSALIYSEIIIQIGLQAAI